MSELNTSSARRRARKFAAGTAAFVLLGSVAAASVNAGFAPRIRPEGIVTALQAEVFVSVSPTRVLDTRGPASGGPVGVPVAGMLQPNSTLDLTLTGAGKPVPVGATAVVLNTTIDLDATDHSFISIYPKGEARSSASSNNALPGLEVSNLTIARLGTGGAISIYNLKGELNLVLDVVGYLVPISSVDGIAGGGNTILNGNGVPAASLGNNGDYYVDNTTKNLYGPKTGNAWPAPPTSLIGPKGDAGPTISTLGTFNNTGLTVALGTTTVPFPIANDQRAGNAALIGHTATDTFVLAPGTYRVDYRVTVGGTLLGGAFQLFLDATPVGASNAVIAGLLGATVSDSVVLTVGGAGANLSLADTGLIGVDIGAASIVVERIA
jgi:hypothetical protein